MNAPPVYKVWIEMVAGPKDGYQQTIDHDVNHRQHIIEDRAGWHYYSQRGPGSLKYDYIGTVWAEVKA